MKYFYSIPINTKSLIEKRQHSLCDLKDSIRMNINLIIKTHYRENRYDYRYGCTIWNKDYSTITDLSKWKDELKLYIAESIEKYEPRIDKIKVALNIEDTELSEQFKDQPLKLKKKIQLHISGTIKHLNEPFEHDEHLFFSPLSIG